MTTALSNVKKNNKDAIILASKLEIGGMAIDLISAQIAKAFPKEYQQIIESTPLAKILIANLVVLLIQQTDVQDDKILAVSETMLISSYQQLNQSFDLVGMLKNVINEIDPSKLAMITK